MCDGERAVILGINETGARRRHVVLVIDHELVRTRQKRRPPGQRLLDRGDDA
jgi:hypothetical protein